MVGLWLLINVIVITGFVLQLRNTPAAQKILENSIVCTITYWQQNLVGYWLR